ncbi:hypothetical protein Hanom_Chr09g00819081 [Helianthus anomalus]
MTRKCNFKCFHPCSPRKPITIIRRYFFNSHISTRLNKLFTNTFCRFLDIFSNIVKAKLEDD